MRLVKGALSLAVLALLILPGLSAAVNQVNVTVLENGAPVEGAMVEVLASDGVTSYVTDQSGEAVGELNGLYFRLKVNGQVVDGGYHVEDGPVTVELNN